MNRLIYAASSNNTDMFYATRFWASDAFLYFEKGMHRYIVLGPLEYDRGCKEAKVHRILNQESVVEQMHCRDQTKIKTHDWIAQVLKQHRTGSWKVSSSFPVGLWSSLQRLGIKLEIQDPLFPERAVKNKEEVAAIRRPLKVTARLLEVAI